VIDDFTMKVRDALIYLSDEVQELAADVYYYKCLENEEYYG
jgi:hypothetical protein